MRDSKHTDWEAVTKRLYSRLHWILSHNIRLGTTIVVPDGDQEDCDFRSVRDLIADDMESVPGTGKVDREASAAMELPPKARRAFFAKRKAITP